MERAEQAANIRYGGELIMSPRWHGFIEGYQQAEKDLTEWHDPKEPPKHTDNVLLKLKDNHLGIIFYSVGSYYSGIYNHPYLEQRPTVIGWREIHE